jgi:toxin ParE1/3/4
MAHEIVWLRAALDDLDEIAGYIARNSPHYAGVVVEKIRASSRDLATFPRMGSIVGDWDDESYRQRLIYDYRLIYRVRADRVEILAVIHGARRLPPAIRNREP